MRSVIRGLIHRTIHLALAFVSLCSVVSFSYADDLRSYDLPSSTIDALERKLKAEQRPAQRIDILLRWVRAKEIFETQQLSKRGILVREDELPSKPGSKAAPTVDAYRDFKTQIIDRLNHELERLELIRDLKLDRLYRELAFRYLELQRPLEALTRFQKMKTLSVSDWMGIGDAHFALNQMPKALEAYHKGLEDPKFMALAAYKRAWSFMSLAQFENSLREFDAVFVDDPHAPSRLKEEAYRDRLRSFVEVFKKERFEEGDAENLKALARRLYDKNTPKALELYLEALQILIDLFNAKAQVAIAESVFFFVKRDSPRAESVLLNAAPLWIKVYRGALDHANVERILQSLPDKALPGDQGILQGELYNTIVFYDNLLKEEAGAQTTQNLEALASIDRAKKCLFLVNAKYFTLFPLDKNADGLRIAYAKLLLEAHQTEDCLNILSHRSGQDPALENLALGTEARCDLKLLDQLYQAGLSDRFKDNLRKLLIDKKTYQRNDLGLSSEQAFEMLARMLIGALKTAPSDQALRLILTAIVTHEILGHLPALRLDLSLLEAELQFVDLAKSSLEAEKKSEQFFAIYQQAPHGFDIKRKALSLSIQLSENPRTLERCDAFKDEFASDFKSPSEVFDRCLLLADRFYDLEREAHYLSLSSSSLDERLKIKWSLIEMALGRDAGRKRLMSLKSSSAQKALEVWSDRDPDDALAQNDLSQREDLKSRMERFIALLKPLRFSQIQRDVPSKIKSWEDLDGFFNHLIHQGERPFVTAFSLFARAKTAVAMATWMQKLPTPPQVSESEKADYQLKSAAVVKPFVDAAEERKKECGSLAYSLTSHFQLSTPEDLEVCPYADNPERRRLLMAEWEKTRRSAPTLTPWQKDHERVQTAQRLLEEGQRETNPLKAKYHFIRVFDFSENEYERARAFLGLAKLSHRPSFWEGALRSDGNVMQALEWKRDEAKGNPFFESLYDQQIQNLRH